MTKKNLRKIIIDGETYLWKREHHHVEKNTSYCQEQLTVYLEKHKKSPLRIYFNESGTKQNQALKWEEERVRATKMVEVYKQYFFVSL